MHTTPEFSLDDALAGFITGGVSIIVASRDDYNRPSLVRALGCRLSADRRQIDILLSSGQSQSLIQDWHRHGDIAVVFTQPSTHRSIQLKGSDARLGAVQPGDAALMRDYREALADDLGQVGYTREFSLALLHCPQDDACVVSFQPTIAFSQTPGPEAGARLEMSS
jgi:hypothetical protein